MLKKLLISFFVALFFITFSKWDAAHIFNELFQKMTQNAPNTLQSAYSFSESGKEVFCGMEYNDVLTHFGDPLDILESEYGFSWNIFHQNFLNYIQIGVQNNRVVGIYTNSPAFSFCGITVGTDKTKVHMTLETPINYIIKNNTKYIMNGLNEEQVNMELFLVENMYVTIFYDVHKNNSVTAIHIIDYETEQSLDTLFGAGSSSLAESFEKQNFYVTNALRVREGLPPLSYHKGAESIARTHSADMATHEYFDHTDLSGGTVFDRAQKKQVYFRSIGENIAMGSQNTLFMHELLMNSEGHRKNILANFHSVGMGIAFSKENVPYLTQNFIG